MSAAQHEDNADMDGMVNRTGLVCLVRVVGVTVLCSQTVGVSRSPLPASPFVHMSTGQGSTPTEAEDHTLPCSHAHVGIVTTACVIAKKLGSVHWLAHSA